LLTAGKGAISMSSHAGLRPRGDRLLSRFFIFSFSFSGSPLFFLSLVVLFLDFFISSSGASLFFQLNAFDPVYHFVVFFVASLLELQISVLGFKTVLRKDVPLSVYGA
jgi:hypothetical protein